ncbi:C-type lectin domain family 4 member A-like isoform X2 [Polypterus senegalus]|uniref:C-type lectin domain family 4 member A-like isoform X2 n=1 Tax=Polypterus senegalus TaxID=55291 RepID=UPI001963F2D7|nr:C-type lectin domain family 4 member A-like isoform X2 [Polypterus senegalus]
MADEVQYVSVIFSHNNQQSKPPNYQEKADVTYSEIKGAKHRQPKQKENQPASPVSTANEDYKACLFKLLLLLCVLLLIVCIFMAVYYFRFQSKELQNNLSALQSRYSALNLSLFDLQSQYSVLNSSHSGLLNDYFMLNKSQVVLQDQYSVLNETNTKLSTRVMALIKYCPSQNLLTQGSKCSFCPDSWQLFNSKCYYFSNDKMDWNLSNYDCLSRGGHLVIIDTNDEQSFLANMNKAKEKFWIGLTYFKDKNEFWWENNVPVDISNKFWGDNQPNQPYKQNNPSFQEYCVLLNNEKWHDYPCGTQANRICEAAAAWFNF